LMPSRPAIGPLTMTTGAAPPVVHAVEPTWNSGWSTARTLASTTGKYSGRQPAITALAATGVDHLDGDARLDPEHTRLAVLSTNGEVDRPSALLKTSGSVTDQPLKPHSTTPRYRNLPPTRSPTRMPPKSPSTSTMPPTRKLFSWRTFTFSQLLEGPLT